MGAMGAGMFCLEGTGAISHMSVRHQLEFFHEPQTYAALCVLGDEPGDNIARVIEGPIPDWKYFGRPDSGNGSDRTTFGLPRFGQAEFLARFPFAMIQLRDPAVPIEVQITGWSPFTPPDADPSSLPVGALEYRFHNTSEKPHAPSFRSTRRNFMGNGSIGSDRRTVSCCTQRGSAAERDQNGAFAFFVDGDHAVVDHCWFRGGWWDAPTIAWSHVAAGQMPNNPPVEQSAPGASLFVPFELPAGRREDHPLARLLVRAEERPALWKTQRRPGVSPGAFPRHGQERAAAGFRIPRPVAGQHLRPGRRWLAWAC